MSKKQLSMPYFKSAPLTVYRSPKLGSANQTIRNKTAKPKLNSGVVEERSNKAHKVDPEKANLVTNRKITANRSATDGEKIGRSNENSSHARRSGLQRSRRSRPSQSRSSLTDEHKSAVIDPESNNSYWSSRSSQTSRSYRSARKNKSSFSGEKLNSSINELEYVDEDLGMKEKKPTHRSEDSI